MFTSELPSSLSTPLATGANTPQRDTPISTSSFGTPPHGFAPSNGTSVNPLLLAATTASNPAFASNPSLALASMGQGAPGHHSHGQTPTSIKIAKMPEYFPEWKDHGFDEVAFLGAQVAAKVVFVVDQGASQMFMSRTQYNDDGTSRFSPFPRPFESPYDGTSGRKLTSRRAYRNPLLLYAIGQPLRARLTPMAGLAKMGKDKKAGRGFLAGVGGGVIYQLHCSHFEDGFIIALTHGTSPRFIYPP